MKRVPVVAAIVAVGLASPAAAQNVALDASDPVTFFVATADGGGARPDSRFVRWAFEAWSEASDGATGEDLVFVATW